MIFNSFTFLLFLIIITVLYWMLPRRPRLWMIFVSSLTFYGLWRWEFIFLLLYSTALDYFVSRGLDTSSKKTLRRLLLGLSLVGNIGMLIFFKYTNFVIGNANAVFHVLGGENAIRTLDIILPLGISFYTFQTMSYTIDVYRRNIRAERDFILYADYVLFFPQLVAGPILRAGEVIWQLDKRPSFSLENIVAGGRRILMGLFLKTVLADNIAPMVDACYRIPASLLSALDVWTMAFLFGLQIYFDFSAYSHIALGASRMMGIKFPENFNFPYSAVSPKDFWKRWHISLSSWVRDYLYLPLKGIQSKTDSTGGLSESLEARKSRDNLALFGSWAIMGLWHGASWTFVVWGLWHAVLVYLYRLFHSMNFPAKPLISSLAGWCLTVPAVMLGWIIFRATSLSQAIELLGKVTRFSEYARFGFRENIYLVTAILFLFVLAAYFTTQKILPLLRRYSWVDFLVKTTTFSVAIILVIIFLRPIKQFIYFQF